MRKCPVIILVILLCLSTSSLAEAKRKVLPKPTDKVSPGAEDEDSPKSEGPGVTFIRRPSEREDKQYEICIGDTVNIRVYGEDELNGLFTVRTDGTIKYPLLGPVKLEGLNRKEAEEKIYALLEKDYLVEPLVYLSLGSYSQQKIFILGCVARPGPMEFTEGKEFTVLQAITEAGGFTRLASVGGVRIIRTDEDGKKIAINPRLNDVMSGKHDDTRLEANDTIIVPERLF